MSIESRFPNTKAMEQILAMRMEEGLTQAVGQIDAILAENVSDPRRFPGVTTCRIPDSPPLPSPPSSSPPPPPYEA